MTNNKFIIKVKKKQVFFENYEKFLAKQEKCCYNYMANKKEGMILTMNCKVEKTENANEVKLELTIEAKKFDEAIQKVCRYNCK